MKKSIIVLGILIAIVIGIVSCLNRKTESVNVFYGNVDDRQVNLAFLIPERIRTIHVEEGVSVKAGQLLAELETIRIKNDIRSAESAVHAANASVESAEANLTKLKNGYRREEILMVEAQIAEIRALLKSLERDYERQKTLKKSEAVSIQLADSAEASYFSQKAKLKNAEANLSMLKAGYRKEDIATAKAQLALAKSQLDQSKNALTIQQQRLTDTKLYAPCAGVIRTRVLEPGEIASASIPVFTLAVTTPKWIRIYVPETSLNLIRQGSKAIIKFDSEPEKKYTGWVGYISPIAEFTPKNVETVEQRPLLVYEFRVYVNDPENTLKLGAPATVVFPDLAVTGT